MKRHQLVNIPRFAARTLFFSWAALAMAATLHAKEMQGPLGNQVVLKPEMVITAPEGVTMEAMLDEQATGENPVMLAAKSMWEIQIAKTAYPLEFILDLGEERHISSILFWDSNGHGNIQVYKGEAGNWQELLVEDGVGINKFKYHQNLDAQTRYLRVVKETSGGIFGEMLAYEYTPEMKADALAQRAEKERLGALQATAEAEKAGRKTVASGTMFGELPLVDEIDFTVDQGKRTFAEKPDGVSKLETVLGRQARVIPAEQEDPSYFAYKIGEGKLLEPNKAYLLTVEFPEDTSRTFTIANRGADMIRGIQTGQSLGDTMFGYTSTNMESLKIPLSGKYETFQQLFWLSETFAGLEMPRGETTARGFNQGEGFYVIVSQWAKHQTPMSAGAAVSRIRLFEVPQPEKFNVTLRLPPAPLPQRHLFYREEMADSVINSKDETQRAMSKPEDWFQNHFRNMNFLGMNTFARDLLEFGAPQYWDVENGAWYHQSKFPDVWGNIVPLAAKHGLNILPYYEYAGSSGPQGLAQKSAENVGPLAGKGDYTHIKWAESKRVDLSDPVVLEEFKRVLDLTIVKYKDQANFIGAWIRPRVSQMPISFADPTRERFAQEANGGTAVTREDLKGDPDLLQKYYDWWNGERQQFLIGVRDHLKEKGVAEDPKVFYMTQSSEAAPAIPTKGGQIPIVTDAKEEWEQVAAKGLKDYDKLVIMDLDVVLAEKLYLAALKAGVKNWGNWEWHHAVPKADPENYKEVPGIMMTYPYNRMFTVADPEGMDLYRAKSGLVMIRHYPLNENTMDELLGYFVTDVDRTGNYGVMAEALAVANGDPFYMGYTSGHIYNRPFPEAVRRFNANFLALPALPSQKLDKAASDAEVVVRAIDAGTLGGYLAVVNTGMDGKSSVTVTSPKAGKITEAATGKVLAENAATVTLNLDPYELRALHVQ